MTTISKPVLEHQYVEKVGSWSLLIKICKLNWTDKIEQKIIQLLKWRAKRDCI